MHTTCAIHAATYSACKSRRVMTRVVQSQKCSVRILKILNYFYIITPWLCVPKPVFSELIDLWSWFFERKASKQKPDIWTLDNWTHLNFWQLNSLTIGLLDNWISGQLNFWTIELLFGQKVQLSAILAVGRSQLNSRQLNFISSYFCK